MFDIILNCSKIDILNCIDLDKINKNNETLMIMLCKEKLGTIGLILLKNKYDENLKFNLEHQDNEKMTALMYAIQNNLTKIAIIIISKMENINQKDENGDTALLMAIKRENISVVKELLKNKNIDINHENIYKKTALMYAGSVDNIEIVKLILNRKDCNVMQKDINGDDVLSQNLINLNEKLLLEIAKKCNDFNHVYFNGNTLLIDSIHLHLLKLTEFIIKSNKCDLTFIDKTNKTALIHAIEERFIKGALLLVDSKENINCNHKDNMKNTALFYSAKYNLIEITNKLLQRNDCNVIGENIYGYDFIGQLMIYKQENIIIKVLKQYEKELKYKYDEIYCKAYCFGLENIKKMLYKKINLVNVNNFLLKYKSLI